ncbi:DUF1269 domain-containing family protein [Streptomyces minutiscleroticus]|uniref:DUF1269 domain-containing family protein n=2 Tax=Streptomyces minutiscleroticus TaxID=68238 RepID=A0A918NFC4_9ACTN|nr:DUF1269 domain-containing protein [Streptomyces minutiscleroticus]GGX68743.1 DUF1269 domain-containing family protein [Streptomyces minutiscleroticus]
MSEMGPVQLLAVAFGPDAAFEGRIIEELEELTAKDQIRVLDLLAVQKSAEGDLVALDYQAEGMGDTVGALLGLEAGSLKEAERVFPSLAPGRPFGLGPEDIRELADALEPGTAAGFLLLEHRWAKELKDALRAQGGVPLAEGFLTAEALASVAAEMLEATARLEKDSTQKREKRAKKA